jgi:hypothetical protein
MKKHTIIILSIIIFSQYCYSQKQILSGKEFLSEDSIKKELFMFLDDSVCIYKQIYNCAIDEKYRLTEIKCKYKIEGELIFLKPINIPEYLQGIDCYLIPETILEGCDLIYANTLESPFDLDVRAKLTKADMYGYVNSIKNGTKLLLYKRDNIIFAKVLTCIPIENRRSSFTLFTQKGKKRISDKTLRKLIKTQKIPINNLNTD